MGFMLVLIWLLFPIPKYTSFPNLVFLEDSREIIVIWRMVGSRVVVTGFKKEVRIRSNLSKSIFCSSSQPQMKTPAHTSEAAKTADQ